MIRAILACDENWGIGKGGTLPWPHNAADQRWFKETTMGGVVAMGKTTWDDPDMPKPLPGRNNVVITSSEKDKDGPYHFIKFDRAEASLIEMNKLQNVWVIGGAKLVESLLPIIDEIWLSRIQGTYDCDTFLPRSLIEEHYYLADSGKQGEVYIDVWRQR